MHGQILPATIPHLWATPGKSLLFQAQGWRINSSGLSLGVGIGANQLPRLVVVTQSGKCLPFKEVWLKFMCQSSSSNRVFMFLLYYMGTSSILHLLKSPEKCLHS